MTSNPRRALDRWARDYGGCADFDTYIRAGGSIMAARDDIGIRVNRLSDALRALQAYPNAPREAERDDRQWVEEEGYPGSLVPSPAPSIAGRATTLVPSPEKGENPMSRAPSPSKRENHITGATIGPEALARAEADQTGDPPDPHNAHAQGADHAE